MHIESRGNTVVGGDTGTMVVRIVQNDQGLVLPPDLLAAAPKLSRRVEAAELVTLIDMDHYAVALPQRLERHPRLEFRREPPSLPGHLGAFLFRTGIHPNPLCQRSMRHERSKRLE